MFTAADTLKSLESFKHSVAYGEPTDLGQGIRATFVDAGHILGSASILLELTEAGRTLPLLFSGDLGNAGRPLLLTPAPPPRADVVVIETTYGDRLHKPMDASIDELYRAISDTLGRGGNVIIPTFALERAQELLWILNQGIAKNRLMLSMQVFLDSPMAISATEIFARHPECLRPEAAQLFREGRDPLALPGLHFTLERVESVALNNVRGGAIIMAGAGMATGGRVRHHLKHNISREECSVIFVGFAAKGTLAADHRWPKSGAYSWGRYPGKSRDPHYRRVLGPRRSGRAIEMAWAYRRGAHFPYPRGGGCHGRVRVAAWQNPSPNTHA